jgi:hypothetical protein
MDNVQLLRHESARNRTSEATSAHDTEPQRTKLKLHMGMLAAPSVARGR